MDRLAAGEDPFGHAQQRSDVADDDLGTNAVDFRCVFAQALLAHQKRIEHAAVECGVVKPILDACSAAMRRPAHPIDTACAVPCARRPSCIRATSRRCAARSFRACSRNAAARPSIRRWSCTSNDRAKTMRAGLRNFRARRPWSASAGARNRPVFGCRRASRRSLSSAAGSTALRASSDRSVVFSFPHCSAASSAGASHWLRSASSK